MHKLISALVFLLMVKTITSAYEPRPKQIQFHVSTETEVFFGGAKGPGKSCALVMEAFAYAWEHVGSDPHIFRETYDALEANIIKEFLEKVPRELYEYNASKHVAYLKNGKNGSIIGGSCIKFRYCSNEIDAAKYQGRSIPWIGIDELTKHTLKEVQILLSCLRSARGWPVKFRATGNPGDIGHAWVKARYIVPTNYGTNTYTDNVTGNVIRFIPATVYDGVLADRDPGYVRRLENLPEEERKAFLLGSWDIFSGQFFSNFGAHLIDREAPYQIPLDKLRGRLFASLDYGFGLSGHTSAGLWWERHDDIPVRLQTVYLTNMGAQEQATTIKDYLQANHYTSGMLPEKWVADTAMWSADGTSCRAPIDFYKDVFGDVFVTANKQRVQGWDICSQHFSVNPLTQKPQLLYWPDTNYSFKEYFPQLIRDRNNPLDVQKCGIDHTADETRYYLTMRTQFIKNLSHTDINKKENDIDYVRYVLAHSYSNCGTGV